MTNIKNGCDINKGGAFTYDVRFLEKSNKVWDPKVPLCISIVVFRAAQNNHYTELNFKSYDLYFLNFVICK